MAVDLMKLARLESELDAKRAALNGLSTAVSDASEAARFARAGLQSATAGSKRELQGLMAKPIAETVTALQSDLSQMDATTSQAHIARALLLDARAALALRGAADRLSAEQHQLQQVVAPLAQLVRNCRRHAGLETTFKSNEKGAVHRG